ncbi:PAS domain S-box protein [Methanococcoides sp. SA1]|nr:PAS domain S-box protein [Methanococcoides sp. SA1]
MSDLSIEKGLLESEEIYKALFEGTAEGILVADIETKKFLFANPAMCKMLGYTEEELMQKSLLDIHQKNDLKCAISEFESQARGEKNLSSSRPCLRKDGTTLYTDINTTNILINGRECNVGFFTDITERKEMETALQKSEQKFRTFFNNSNDPILIYDLDGLILEVNEVACEFTGYGRDELLNMSIMDLDSSEYASNIPDNIKQLQKGKCSIFESVAICKDGTPIHIELSNRIIDYDGKTAVLSTSRNLTKRKQAEDAMFNAKLVAEAANRTKDEFIANMTHELRTPLNAVIGFSEMLMLGTFGTLNEKQTKYANNINSSGKHLLDVINDILDLSKVEAGKMGLHPEEFEVSSAIEEVNMLVAPMAEKKRIKISTDIADDAIVIEADKTKFKQILYNLLSNAIKFTDQGGSVTIGGMISEDLLHISVKDSGIGISPEDQDKLFNPFFQADSSSTRKYGGAGLGLALIKKFVEMHGGEIWVESEVGKGSTFGFSIPTNLEGTSH